MGGGGGGSLCEPDSLRAWLTPFTAGRGFGCATDAFIERLEAAGVGLGRDASFEGPPPGPPGRSSLPFVMGLPGTCLPRGVGRETEFGGSPGPVWILPLLYTSSLGTAGSLIA
jgi:hypothetical protein